MKNNPLFVIVTPSFYPSTFYGGPALSLFNFCMAVARTKHSEQVMVVTSNADGQQQLNFTNGHTVAYAPNFKTVYYNVQNSRSNSIAFFRGIKHHLEQDAKVVYIASVFSLSSIVAMYYARKKGRTIVLAPLGQVNKKMLALKSSIIKKIWLRLFIRPISNKVLWHVKSEPELHNLREIFFDARCILSPNGFWLTDYTGHPISKHQLLENYKLPQRPDSFFVASIGRIHSQKRFDLLIDAFALLKNAFPLQPFILLIGGNDNGGKDNLMKQIATLGLTEEVVFLGYLNNNEKEQLLTASDCFALTSSGENFGQVYLESLACGTPIISTTETPWTNVEALGIGYCAEPTVDSVFEKLKLMYENRHTINRERCKKYAQEHFEWNAVANAFMKQLNELIEP